MGLIVQKFGGSSVKDCDHLYHVARIIAKTQQAGNQVIVVVSAQGNTTDVLMKKASEIAEMPPERELDMLLSTGEQVSISLLTMALNKLGCNAISLTGWQAGFRTDTAYTKAKICGLDATRIIKELQDGKIVVVAGFQGVTPKGDITTLGRGGSDTSAVAIAAALHADKCQIYTDVEGVYTADPRLVATAQKFSEITFDEMLTLAEQGSQVLNKRSVALAKRYNVELEVLSSLTPAKGTLVHQTISGGCNSPVKGIAKDANAAIISMPYKTGEPDIMQSVFAYLTQEQIKADVFVPKQKNCREKQLRLSVNEADVSKVVHVLAKANFCNIKDMYVDRDCANVSVIGIPLQNCKNSMEQIKAELDEQNISIKMLCIDKRKVSILVARENANQTVRVLHTMLIG